TSSARTADTGGSDRRDSLARRTIPIVEDAPDLGQQERAHLQDAWVPGTTRVERAARGVRVSDHQTAGTAGSLEIDRRPGPVEPVRRAVAVPEDVDGSE